MRRRAGAIALAGLVGLAGTVALVACTDAPPRVTAARSPTASAPASAPSGSPSASPSTPRSDKQQICARVRETTRSLGSAVPRKLHDAGYSAQQVLDVVRAVYQYAETSLAGQREETTDPGLADAIGAVATQYADIRARLNKPDDVNRVNFEPAALKTALANLDRTCR